MFHPSGPTFWELARQCLSSTEHGYDLLAPKFDYTPFRTPDEVLTGLAPYLGPPQSIDSALDICCGTGAGIQILRPLCRQRIVGIDFSRGMLEIARQTYKPEVPQGATAGLPSTALPAIEFLHANVLEMSFPEKFDLAITLGSLGHILPRDEPRFVERIAAALKPGGRFIFVTTEMPPLWSPRYLLSRGFNAAMHIRNAIKRPPFIMFYLTFLLPRASLLLEQHGFAVTVHDNAFPGRYSPLKVVVATKHPKAATVGRD
jgi:SAM-dependent methyltransferase